MSGSSTTGDLAELSLQVNYDSVTKAGQELLTFQERSRGAGREADALGNVSRNLDQTMGMLSRSLGLQGQALQQLLPQYQAYVRFATELQTATMQLSLEQSRYATALREVDPVLRNIGLFHRTLSDEARTSYERLSLLARQLSTTTAAYREAAEASQKFTNNLAEQRNIQQQFMQAFTGSGTQGAAGRQRLEDYIGPLGDMSASEAMQRFAERLRSVRDVAVQTRDAMAVLGTTSLETVRNLERLASVDIGASQRETLRAQQAFADNQAAYRNEMTRLTGAANDARPEWWVSSLARSAISAPGNLLMSAAPNSAIAGAVRGAADWWNAPGAPISLQAASFAQDLEFQTHRREAEFNSFLNRNLGWSLIGRGAIAAANYSPFGGPSMVSTAAMIPGAWDYLTGREGPGMARPVMSSIQNAPLQALAMMGSLGAQGDPMLAAQLSRLNSSRQLEQLERLAPGAWDQATYLAGIGPDGRPMGASASGGGLMALVRGEQQQARDMVRELLSAPGGQFQRNIYAFREMEAAGAARQASDFMGGASQRAIDEMEQLSAAALQGASAVTALQARLSDSQAIRPFLSTTGQIISGLEGVAGAALEAARATRFGPQLQAFYSTGAATRRQVGVASLAQGFGGWANPLADQEAALMYEMYDALDVANARYTDPTKREQARANVLATYDTRRSGMQALFEINQANRIGQGIVQAQFAGLGGGLLDAGSAGRLGAIQQVFSLNPQAFMTNGQLNIDLVRGLTSGYISDPNVASQWAALAQTDQGGLLQRLFGNSQQQIETRTMQQGLGMVQGAFGGYVNASLAGLGPAAQRQAAAGLQANEAYIQEAAARYGVPPELIRMIAMQESGIGTNPNALRNGGGVMQIIRSTWNELRPGVDPSMRLDPRENIMAGTDYVRRLAGNVDLTNVNNWAPILRRYNGGGDPNYVANVMRWANPAMAGALADRAVTLQVTGAAEYGASSSEDILAAMRMRIRNGSLSGTFESTQQALQQAASQGITDSTAIRELEQALARAAAAQARLNMEREAFNSRQEFDGYERFNQVMRETGGNIDAARAAMERFVAARRAGLPEDDASITSRMNAASLAGIGRVGVEESLRGQSLGQANTLAGLEFGTFGLPERQRQMILQLAQEDMRFNSQVDRLRAGVNQDDPESLRQFGEAETQARNVYQTNRETIAQTAQLRGMLQDAQRAQEMLLEPLRGALRNLQTEASNFWRVILEGGSVAGKDMEKLFGNILKNAAAQFLGTFTTNTLFGGALSLFGMGSFGSSLGIPTMGGGMGGGLFGGVGGGSLPVGSFGGGGVQQLAGGLIGSFGGGGGGRGVTLAGTPGPNGYQRSGYMSSMTAGLGNFMPLIATSTGMGSLNGIGAMMGMNDLMSLNTGGQGLLSWQGLTNAGENFMARSTFLDRTFPSLFGNGAEALGKGIGSFGTIATDASTLAGWAPGLSAIPDAAALGGKVFEAGASFAPEAMSSGGALGMTGAQALSGLGAIAGVANFAMNPSIGSGIGAAGSVMSALASFGVIGSAFGPIGMALAAVGALVSLAMGPGKRGHVGASGQIYVTKDGQLMRDGVGGKGMDVSGFDRQLFEMTDAINRANSELNLKVDGSFGRQLVAVGDASKETAGWKMFNTSDPYLSLARQGLLRRDGDNFLNDILLDRKQGFSINRSSVDTFAQAIKFYDNYYKDAIKTENAPNQLIQQQQDLRKTFTDGLKEANRLGFDQGMIRTGYRSRFNEDTRRGVLGITDPMELALEDFDKLAAERVQTARLIGADINQVEKLNGEERKRIVEQYMGGISNAFRSALKALTQGDLAGETDLSKYNASLLAYSSLVTKYPTASVEDQGRFIEQAMTLVGNARSLFSDTPEFAAVYQRVLGDLLKFAPDGSDEGNAAKAALERLKAGYGNSVIDLKTLPNTPAYSGGGTATPSTTQSLADLVASSPLGKDIAEGMAPGLAALGELIASTNSILTEILSEQKTTNTFIRSVVQQTA